MLEWPLLESTGTWLSCAGTEIKCVHDMASHNDDKRGHKNCVIPTVCYPASSGVQQKYGSRLFSISYGRVMKMSL